MLRSTQDHEGHDRSVKPGRHAAINALRQPGNGVFRSRENLLLEHVIQIGAPPAVVIENGDRSLAVGFRPELGVGRGFRVEHLVPHDHLYGARIFGLCCQMNATSVSTVPASHRWDYASSAQLSVPAGTFHFYANTITAGSMPAWTDTNIPMRINSAAIRLVP